MGGGLKWKASKSLTFRNYKIEDEDYVVASVMARYQASQHLAAPLNVNNLFDETYYTSAGQALGPRCGPESIPPDLRPKTNYSKKK